MVVAPNFMIRNLIKSLLILIIPFSDTTMPKALSHSDCRKLVCGVCLRKEKHNQTISEKVLVLIKKHHYENYSIEDDHLPTIACMSCVATLKAIDKSPENAKRKTPFVAYDELQKPKTISTRSTSNTVLNLQD